MSRFSKILWGLVLIGIGVILATNSLGITQINLFFPGWWSFLIIVPCFIGLFDSRSEGKIGNLVGILIGMGIFLSINGVLRFQVILKLIVPVILIGIGLSILFNGIFKNSISKKVKDGKKEGIESIAATFSGQKVNKENEEFKGAELDAIFGSVELDLRKAILPKESVIYASSIFGGIDIRVPSNVNIKLKSTGIFGGTDNEITNQKENDTIIYIETFCMFGGVEIK